jgi:hypothetical protein
MPKAKASAKKKLADPLDAALDSALAKARSAEQTDSARLVVQYLQQAIVVRGNAAATKNEGPRR